MANGVLLTLLVLLRAVLFHDGAGGDFFRAFAVAAGFPGAGFDVLVHPLLFLAHTAKTLALWHRMLPA